MIREATDCIDAGSEFCPCKLAEMGECIICSQMHGKCFCDCSNWKGVCIYQEFFNNGMKAKEGRGRYNCKIININNYDDELLVIKLEVIHKLALDLINPGSYIFLCPDKDIYFDIPISILESDVDKNIISLAIEIRGIKTKKLLNFKEGDTIDIRGPYWNGIFGIKDIEKQKESKCLVLSKGMGIAPMVPVVRKLRLQNCEVELCLDYSNFDKSFISDFISKYDTKNYEFNLLDKGELSNECKKLIRDSIDNGTTYIHIAGADILTLKVIEFLDYLGRSDILLSCCNNFKMCCGEGICGACTARYKGHKVKRFCKVQTDPRSIFEERRLI
ncbi:sulfide/dihydroorotate dehydrogenase-like FAD/NAD-binding protein [Clostridium sardiniense]